MSPEPSSDRIERRLTTLFPSTALEDHAEAVGVVERDGKFQVPARECAGKRVDEEIKEMVFVDFVVGLLVRSHTISKQTVQLTALRGTEHGWE